MRATLEVFRTLSEAFIWSMAFAEGVDPPDTELNGTPSLAFSGWIAAICFCGSIH